MRLLLYIGGTDGYTHIFPCHSDCQPFRACILDDETHYLSIVDEGDTLNPVFQDFIKHRLTASSGFMPKVFWSTRTGNVYRVKHLQLKAVIDATQRSRYNPVCLPMPYCDGTYLVADRPYFGDENPDAIINLK